jgi:hypothetical protein
MPTRRASWSLLSHGVDLGRRGWLEKEVEDALSKRGQA